MLAAFEKVNKIKFLSIFILTVQYGFTSSITESWSSVGFEKKILNSITLDIEQSLRTKDNISSFKQTFTEASFSYSLHNGLKIFIPVRYAVFNEKIKKRISLGFSYKYNFKPFTLKYRSKFQRSFQKDKIFDPLARNKLAIDYKINKKVKPYLSGEVFHFINSDQYENDERRCSIGLNMSFSKKKKIKVFYTYKIEGINKSNPDKTNVIGLAYTLKL